MSSSESGENEIASHSGPRKVNFCKVLYKTGIIGFKTPYTLLLI